MLIFVLDQARESSRKIDIAIKKERVWESEPVSKRAKKSEVVRCQIKSKYKTAKKTLYTQISSNPIHSVGLRK